jgi:hypothetical protein
MLTTLAPTSGTYRFDRSCAQRQVIVVVDCLLAQHAHSSTTRPSVITSRGLWFLASAGTANSNRTGHLTLNIPPLFFSLTDTLLANQLKAVTARTRISSFLLHLHQLIKIAFLLSMQQRISLITRLLRVFLLVMVHVAVVIRRGWARPALASKLA